MEAVTSKAEQTRRRILDAAFTEFSAHGVAGARVDRIASLAGANKNLLYVYYGSKEGLFTAVLGMHLARLYEEIPFTPDDLPGFGARVFDWAMTHTDVMRLVAWSTLEQSGRNPENRAASHDEKIQALQQRLTGDAADHAFSPAFLVTTVMAIATAWSPALPFGTAMHPDQPPALDELREQVVAAVRRLISPHCDGLCGLAPACRLEAAATPAVRLHDRSRPRRRRRGPDPGLDAAGRRQARD